MSVQPLASLPATAPDAALNPSRPSLYLCDPEEQEPDGEQPDLFAGLDDARRRRLLAMGTVRQLRPGEPVFRQGDPHEGIHVILSGIVRVFHTSPAGREITLAYWSAGNFVGGPELFGVGAHTWSGAAVRPLEILALRGRDLRQAIAENGAFAVNLVDALVQKSRCYSAVIHMLGTRSVTQRLAQLLLAMERPGADRGGRILGRPLTHEELARMVGATRQWVSTTLERFREQGLIEPRRHGIAVRDEHGLRALAGGNSLTDEDRPRRVRSGAAHPQEATWRSR